ncbi:sigma-70 family RNA polymerase sigma factor [Pseudomonas sp. P66]|uniref:Sigma-70 family RNA polymerase sigma factor n=1 Tax=Pseudomonas arcuscaelestis TaxID=2710591 RepID=A0ABS2BTE9_9PSED|nr:sigma-70 family RNA polymerase sigma factor [Pseudomonas arcuscaelestis]MBM3111287.1 sigma-70 family RNA polymerase sigma factor [Pseudomonas arcuscaelestis]MBM5456710.1 sigma-70 family RNA polymerase sigma factor [Pseudomonas arcuscaelestis]
MNRSVDTNTIVADLYSDHHRWLRAWLYRRLNCPDDAADLAQDTFVRAMGSSALPALEEPRAFLATVARRLLSNLFRRRALEQAYLEALGRLPECCMPSVEDVLLVREALAQIDRLLDGLPTRARHAFILHRLEGMSQPMIATQLGVSLATVERDLRRAFLHCLSVEAE